MSLRFSEYVRFVSCYVLVYNYLRLNLLRPLFMVVESGKLFLIPQVSNIFLPYTLKCFVMGSQDTDVINGIRSVIGL